jgi:hypothetical protein
MIVLQDDENPEKSPNEIQSILIRSGHDDVKVHQSLNALKERGVVARNGENGNWRLTEKGREELYAKGLAAPKKSVVVRVRDDLREILVSIPDSQTRAFVEEAILCLEAGALRSAIIMSWAGCIAVLYGHVLKNPDLLEKFNHEAQKRKPKWKLAHDLDGLSEMKESEFIEILDSLGVIPKNDKKRMLSALDDRNRSAHPNSSKIGENQVAGHIEYLVLHVFSKF